NHEYYAGAEAWMDHLRAAGVHVLCNHHEVVERDGDPLVLAGVDDFAGPRFGSPGPRLDLALAEAPAGVPVILLAHQPPAIGAASRAGVALQLSGHTHGGQIVPFNFLVRLDQPHVAGLYRAGDTWLYVSRGTGWWGPPMRLGAPAEVTLIELASA
ncbi:MAG: metallophosphoesterase, partial [Proteobacteria bacterium]|nr:metallophosphoesterase [Pseudomonadota bacterium]